MAVGLGGEEDDDKAHIESIARKANAALEHLAKAVERTPGLRDWARRDPDLAFMRDAPRFRALAGTTSEGEIHDD